jgi:hypothetical protein
MDPLLSHGAGLAIEGAYLLGKTIEESPLLGTYLNTHGGNSAIDFDDLMPALMECEDQRCVLCSDHTIESRSHLPFVSKDLSAH